MSDQHQPNPRPSWDSYFMGMAYLASLRSHDARTKCGTCLVRDKKILSLGYNGFPSNIKEDDNLPNYDSAKYPFVIHSERNAINNCQVDTRGATAYITGRPCKECAKDLWQAGVRVWHTAKNISTVSAHWYDDDTQKVYDLLFRNGLVLHEKNYDLSFIRPPTVDGKREKVVVAASGYFNPLHKGHIAYLEAAAALGDSLVVLVNNDAQVKLKGSKPFMNEKERAEIVSRLKFVDQTVIVIDQDRSVSKTLEMVKPNIFANGTANIEKRNCLETEVCERLGIEMKFCVGGRDKIQSSSWLLEPYTYRNYILRYQQVISQNFPA